MNEDISAKQVFKCLIKYVSDQSWNNSWRSAAQLLLAWTDHQKVEALLLFFLDFSMVTCIHTTRHKTSLECWTQICQQLFMLQFQ